MKTFNSLNLKALAVIMMLSFTTLAFGQTVSVCKVAKVYQNVKEIEVDAVFADVRVMGSERTDVDFAGEIFGTEQDENVTIRHYLDGDVLKISVKNDKWLKWTWDNYKGTLNLQIPKDMRLSINSASGDVTVKECSGELKAETVSGSVEATNIKGKLHASSVSGDVNINKASNLIGKGKFSTVSGSVMLESIKGEISASSVSGSVNISNFEGAISASAVSGSISGDNILLTANSNFNSISGSINMKLLNPAEALSFELSSVSGSIKAKDIKAEGELQINKGAIRVKGSTISGSQKYE